jgi:hypothetical protein
LPNIALSPLKRRIILNKEDTLREVKVRPRGNLTKDIGEELIRDLILNLLN